MSFRKIFFRAVIVHLQKAAKKDRQKVKDEIGILQPANGRGLNFKWITNNN